MATSTTRRVLQIGGGLVAAGLLGVALAPVLFKDRILSTLQAEINRQILADVAFTDASITVLSSFPDLTVTLSDLTVTNRAPFTGVTLLRAEQVGLTLDLMSVIGGEHLEIRAVLLSDAALDVRVDAEGRANTDITAQEAEAAQDAAAAEAESGAVTMALSSILLTNLDVTYDDVPGDTQLQIDDLDFRGSGDLAASRSDLRSRTDIVALTFRQGGVPYLSKVKLGWDLVGALEQGAETKVTLTENRLVLNDLTLGAVGTVATVGPDLDLDLSLDTGSASLKNLLSLVPSLYTGAYANVASKGSLGLTGTVKGRLPGEGDDLPALDLRLTIADGSFNVPDVPVGLDAVNVDLSLVHPGGPPDQMVIDVPRFALTLDGSPLAGSMSLRTPVSDPDVKLVAKGKLDLAKLQQLVPIEGATLTGLLDLDLDVAGRVSQFSEAGVGDVRATGRFSASGLVYEGPEVPDPVRVEALSATLTPQVVDVPEARLRIGSSDLSIRARLENVVGYALADQTLGGTVDLTSSYLDLDALSGPSSPEPAAASPAESAESSVIVVPSNLSLRATTRIEKIRYDKQDYTDVRGAVSVDKGTLTFEDLGLAMLGGRASMRGTYRAKTSANAEVDVTVTAERLSVSQAAADYTSFRKVVPLAEGLAGTFGGSARFNGKLGSDLTPDLPSLFSQGEFKLAGVSLATPALAGIGAALKDERFSKFNLDGRQLSYVLEGGQLELRPLALKVGDVEGTLQGKAGALDHRLDLQLGLTVPAGKLAAGVLDSLPGGGDLDVLVLIGGTYEDPKVTVKPGKATAAVVAVAVSALADAAREKGDALIALAEQQAAEIRAEAKKKIDTIKADAKKEIDAQLKAAKGNPVLEKAAKKVADELKKKADEAAKKAEKKADEKADELVAAAKKEKDRLIAEAEKKAAEQAGAP